MPEPTPARIRDVYFVGAGLSAAAGLPNTPSLIDSVLVLAKQKNWLVQAGLAAQLDRAFRFFYPDAVHAGFRPSVVDFFSTLRTFLDVGSRFVGTGFTDAPGLYRTLKLAIAHVLMEGVRNLGEDRPSHHDYLGEIMQPGNVVITSNWDLLIERTAQLRNVPVRFCGEPDNNSLLLLKLHGSIDWSTSFNAKRAITTADYASLKERLFVVRPYTFALNDNKDELDEQDPGPLIRTRSLESWNSGWSKLRSRTWDPHMVTMVRGKSGDLGPLRDIWRDAYGALSRAKNLEIVGYSMPDDDAEIRTLLRAGIHRGTKRAKVVVRNPAPDVHDRVRAFLERSAHSSYLPVEPV